MPRKTYSELMLLESFDERLRYLQVLEPAVGKSRKLSERFYKSKYWVEFVRTSIINRDLACDMGLQGFYIPEGSTIIVHHLNPITDDDILNNSDCLYDFENLVCVSIDTHNKIHYKTSEVLDYVERKPGDTKLW